MRSSFMALFLVAGVIALLAATGNAAPQAHVYTYDSGSRQGWLGVQLQDVTKKLKEQKSLTVEKGAYVDDVTEESPAEKAGIQEGDVIVKFDGKEITDSDDLVEAVRHAKRDADVKIDVVRKGDRKTVTATIDRAPRSYSYNYRMAPMPRMPKLPRMPRMERMPYGNFHGFSFSTSSTRLNGLEVQELTRQLADYFQVPEKRGLLVVDVEKGSEGEKAGFKAGDVITKLDGESVHEPGDLSETVRHAKKNSDLPCDVIRKGTSVSLKWHVGSYRDDDEEDDDDTSFNTPLPHTPSNGCEAGAGRMNQLRMELDRFASALREHLRAMKAFISEKVADVLDAVSRG